MRIIIIVLCLIPLLTACGATDLTELPSSEAAATAATTLTTVPSASPSAYSFAAMETPPPREFAHIEIQENNKPPFSSDDILADTYTTNTTAAQILKEYGEPLVKVLDASGMYFSGSEERQTLNLFYTGGDYFCFSGSSSTDISEFRLTGVALRTPALEGPRGLRVGDPIEKAIAAFRCEPGHVMVDKWQKIQHLYGDIDQRFFIIKEYGGILRQADDHFQNIEDESMYTEETVELRYEALITSSELSSDGKEINITNHVTLEFLARNGVIVHIRWDIRP